MPKVKLTTGRAGPSGSHVPGDVIEVAADEAARMLAAGQCVPVELPAKKPRTASKRTSKPA